MVIPAEARREAAIVQCDLVLADLASRRGMTLATLDTGIDHPAVEVL